MVRDFKRAERKRNDFFPTNTTSRKELGYQGVKVVKLEQVFAPRYVERLSCSGGSRESEYY